MFNRVLKMAGLGSSAGTWMLAIAVTLAFQPIVTAQKGDADRSLEMVFEDFLHFSILGRFDVADSLAGELLGHEDLDAVALLQLSQENGQSVDTLVTLIHNSSISSRASEILDLILEGEHRLRQDEERIKSNIEKLGGDPQNEYYAIAALADSGEYAVPWMIETLKDESKMAVWPRVIRAFPKIGHPAVNPLVMALQSSDERIRRIVGDALGQLGYGQAIPYLLEIMHDSGVSPESKSTAVRAAAMIEHQRGRPYGSDPATEFVRLANQYYAEHGSVRADDRLQSANVWYWDDGTQFLSAIPVPTEIFGAVMSMRCCERALGSNSDRSDAVSLWLAGNIRREARLGLNTESGDASEANGDDKTRPAAFPRALYFTSAAGPRYAQQVLRRAIADGDSPVALGAIAALREVGGASSLIGNADDIAPLVAALEYPELLVRIRAALALGSALPREPFSGSELVTPLLGMAVAQTGKRNLLVVDPDEDNLNRVMSELRNSDTHVIGSAGVLAGMERARTELSSLGGIFVASNVTGPEADMGIERIREQYEIAASPIVLMIKPGQQAAAEVLVGRSFGVAGVDAGADERGLTEAWSAAAAQVGHQPIDSDLALTLALEATSVLKGIALDGRTVPGGVAAERPLISVLGSKHEPLRFSAIEVLSLLGSGSAQAAIAGVALDDGMEASLRLAALQGLGESARRFGNQLGHEAVDALIGLAFEESDLTLRTAGGQALGALNVGSDKASRAILKFHKG